MVNDIAEEWEKRIPRTIPLIRDLRANPRLFNHTWATWYNELDD